MRRRTSGRSDDRSSRVLGVSENGRIPPVRARGHARPRQPLDGHGCSASQPPFAGFVNCLFRALAPGPGRGGDGTQCGAGFCTVGGGPVTAPLARRKQDAVIRMYFEGLSYDQIARHAGVGKGSVEEIIRRLKSGEYEEFQNVQDLVETLRDTAVMVRREFSGDVERAHVGSVAWAGLNRLGVDPAKVPEWARMFEDLATSEVPAAKFAEIAVWAWRLQKEIGVPLLELPQRLEVLTEKVKSSL